jgi:ATP-dependent DNA helicase PIF1
LIAFELGYDSAIKQHQRDEAYEKMNESQRHCFNIIIAAVKQNPISAHFFLQGYTSTGKTFLYNAICNHFRAKKKIIICVASSNIAALLLPGGSTSHSRFYIPLNSTQSNQCNISKGTQATGLLERASLIIWDEMPMQNKYNFKTINQILRDIRDCEKPFGGLPVILNSDFAQILPVVKRANRARTMTANLQQSFL